MNNPFGQIVPIIREAAKSPLGVLSLLILVTSILAYYLFQDANELIRLGAFLPLLVAFVLFIFAIARLVSSKPGELQITAEMGKRMETALRDGKEGTLVRPPSTTTEYVRFWRGYVGEYWAYNPSYEVEKQANMQRQKIIEEDFVPFYTNLTKASYLFFTGDKAGQDALAYFSRMMNDVQRLYPGIRNKIEVRELNKLASTSDGGIYRGTRNDMMTSVLELTQKALAEVPGLPRYYLVITDAQINREFSEQFNRAWREAEQSVVQIFKVKPAKESS